MSETGDGLRQSLQGLNAVHSNTPLSRRDNVIFYVCFGGE